MCCEAFFAIFTTIFIYTYFFLSFGEINCRKKKTRKIKHTPIHAIIQKKKKFKIKFYVKNNNKMFVDQDIFID